MLCSYICVFVPKSIFLYFQLNFRQPEKKKRRRSLDLDETVHVKATELIRVRGGGAETEGGGPPLFFFFLVSLNLSVCWISRRSRDLREIAARKMNGM
jgi:hypothetical protein